MRNGGARFQLNSFRFNSSGRASDFSDGGRMMKGSLLVVARRRVELGGDGKFVSAQRGAQD
ncbi:MAG TPA: hypothetical protein VEQ42_03640, partial [Pyrinomonadaceae bacterium]|nr:hypothetical protein [Pyrinomonadaceae bacterium]